MVPKNDEAAQRDLSDGEVASEPPLKRVCSSIAKQSDGAVEPGASVHTGANANRVESRTLNALAHSPSDTQNHNTNMSTPQSPAVSGDRASTGRTPAGSGISMGLSRSPLLQSSVSPAGTPTKDIDTLMGGEPLTETDERGNTRFYPVFVKSDGTQCPVSAEYLRAMNIDWPPAAPVHMHQDLEAIASELYQQAIAGSHAQHQQSPANRRAPTPLGASTSGGLAGCSHTDNIDPVAAAALAQAGLRGVGAAELRRSEPGASPPFSPRGSRPRSLQDDLLREPTAEGSGPGASGGEGGASSGQKGKEVLI